MDEITQEEVAENLLFGLWQNIDSDYKKRYVKNIWEQFENAVRAATYTDKLTKFIEIFKSRLPCELQGMYTKDIFNFLNKCKEDYKVLTWLREETTYLVMICRMLNQEKKETLKNK